MKHKLLILVAFLTVSSVFSQKKWTLRECVDHALKNNITIQQNALNVELAELDAKDAKNNFLPDFSASTGGSLSFGTSFDPVSQNRISQTIFGGSVSGGSNITVFNGFRNLNLYKQAKLGIERSKLALEEIQNDVSLRVVNGYLNVLLAKENYNVAKFQAEISQGQIKAFKDQYENGLIPKADYLNVEATAANDIQNQVTLQNALTIALLNLSQILQLPSEGFDVEYIDVGSPTNTMYYANSAMVYEKALTTQPQIKNAELALDNADYNIEIAKGAFLPTLGLGMNLATNYGFLLNAPAGFKNARLGTQLSDNFGYGVGFNISIPVFNRFRTKNNVDRQLINKERSEVDLENEKLQLEQIIEQAYVDAKAAAKSYEAAKISLESQREAFKNAKQSFELGAMTVFDFDLVRNRLVAAESTLIRSKYDYVFRVKVLQFYYGDLALD